MYAKSLEVLDKVLETQQRLFVPVGKAGQIPLKEIDEDDVLINIEYILIELRRIKTRMGINFRIEPAPSGIGAPFSMTYKTLADASFMLDGLRGRTLTTNDVYGNAVLILDELALVAERLNTPLSYQPTPVETTMKTLDVALQVMRVRYQLVDMQTMLGMDASGVPSMTLSRVTLVTELRCNQPCCWRRWHESGCILGSTNRVSFVRNVLQTWGRTTLSRWSC